MNRPSAITVALITAVLFAGAASMMAYRYIKNQTQNTVTGVPVATAAVDIPVGTKLQSQMVHFATWPKDYLPRGACSDFRTLQGRVAICQLTPGDIITDQKLMPANGAAGGGILAYTVPKGHRAVTVAVNEVAGVAGFITPNSRVDVVLTTPRPGMEDREVNDISKIILQNVPVLATGQVTNQNEGKPKVVPTVTLDMTPSDAEKLIVGVGGKKGSIQLLLRNVIDVASVSTKGETIPEVLGVSARPHVSYRRLAHHKSVPVHVTPVPQPLRTVSVEILRGSAKFKREFPLD